MLTISPNSPKKLPKQERSQSTVETLIQATARILEREGRERLSTNRIAEVAGVSIGSLYQYFPNKESILAELRRRYDERFLDRMLSAAARLGPMPLRDAVREFVGFMIEIHAESPKLHNALAADVPEGQRSRLQQIALAYLEAHREEVRRDHLALAALVSIQAGEALIHGAALRSPDLLEAPEFIEEVTDLLVRYLAR